MLSEFAKQKFTQSKLGVEATRFSIKHNSTTSVPAATPDQRGYDFLYVGRLSEEKGIQFLLRLFLQSRYTLKIIGHGELAQEVQHSAAQHTHIHYLGAQSKEFVDTQMRICRALLLPSLGYENLPNVLTEAFAVGAPVICTNNLNLSQFVHHKKNGLTLYSCGCIIMAGSSASYTYRMPHFLRICVKAHAAAMKNTITDARNVSTLIRSYEDLLKQQHKYT